MSGLVKRIAIVSMTALVVCFWMTPFAAAEIKELKIGVGIDADSLLPNEQTTTLMSNMCELLYDTYFYQTPDGKLEPRLATGYEASADGMIYTVSLRKGVKFHDGTDFNANVVKSTFERLLDPEVKVPTRFLITQVEKCTVVDDYTVQLHLKYPFAPMPQTLSLGMSAPISPAAIEKYGKDLPLHPVGAGPYRLAEWVKGERIVMERNEDYYGEKPTVAKLIWQIVPEDSTREAMLRSGQIDICYKPVPADVAMLQADPKITVDMPLDTRTIFMGLNCQKEPTNNKLVRQAFNYAVDKKAICEKILFGTAEPMDAPISSIVWGYAKMDHQYDYDPEKAKALLKEANFDFEQTVQMRTPNGRYLFDKQVSEAIQAYLQDIGVKVELRVFDWPTYVAGLLKPIEETELRVFLLGWGPMYLDADFQYYGQFHCKTNPPKGLGSAFYCNPEFDAVVDEARMEQAPEKRLDLYKKASSIIWDDCPWIWLHVEKFVIAYSSKIKNMVVTNTEKFYPTYITME